MIKELKQKVLIESNFEVQVVTLKNAKSTSEILANPRIKSSFRLVSSLSEIKVVNKLFNVIAPQSAVDYTQSKERSKRRLKIWKQGKL